MKTHGQFRRWLCLWLLGVSVPFARAELLINEVLFNPPFGDTTNEFVELRGTPNYIIPNGTYLVSVEGDGGGSNPGSIQNIFDLSGRRVGQNGFLLLLQKFHRYKPNPLSTVLTNSDSGEGWGSGSSSSLDHRGDNGQIEIENASCTFFLIQTAVEPDIGDDIDGNDDGWPDGVFTNWLVLDSVGALDNTGDGDFAYGRINFRSDKPPGDGATVRSGTIVPVPFTPGHVGRNGNTSDWEGTNWVASDNLLGKPPSLFLGGNSSSGTNTFPYKRSRAALNHLGGPNFKAPVLPSVIVRETKTSTLVSESGLKDYYTLNLSLRATGAVTIQIEAEFPALVSTNGGKSYGAQGLLTLTSTSAKKVMVRALDDGMASPSQQTARITHTVIHSLDSRYPTNTLIVPVSVTVLDANVVLLSEAKINPPGEDAPFEFVELRGPPGKRMTNLYLVSIQGNGSGNPGLATLVVNMTGQQFGTNGLLVVAAPGNPYSFSSNTNTTVLLAPQLTNSGGVFDNGSVSLLLVGSRQPVIEGTDFDNGDNGTLEGLPPGAFIVDAIAWFRENPSGGDAIYGGVDLSQNSFTPDAASRFPWDRSPRSASAWFVGDLTGSTGESLTFDPVSVSTNVRPGAVMSPGIVNRKAPRLTPNPLPAVSGVLGDPDNETVTFMLSVLEDDDDNFKSDDDADDYVPATSTSLTVTVASDNQAVVPDANLTLTYVAPGKWRLAIEPVGVGYAWIAISATDGNYTRVGFVEYGASAQGRPGAKWHTGISDASTAMPIDANWMFVGDDENQVLRIYSRTRSGGAIVGRDMNPFLNMVDFYDDGTPKEVDIEGSTRVGNRIYWLGSHSHAFNATERTNRARLFATDVSGSGTNTQLRVLAHYDFLKLDLLAWDANNRHGKGANYYGFADSAAEGTDPKAPDGSGFNLEGLCMAPGPNNTTNAYIAFRAPLVPPTNRVHALLIPVLNYGKITTRRSGPGSAQFGAPIELNLGGRGVRSIEGIGTNYLIVAGPPGAGDNLPPPGNFRLFTWTGRTNEQPQERAADLAGLNPEGIVEVPAGIWTGTNLFQIISDNGTNIFYGDDIQAKHLEAEGKPREFKKFRVDTIELSDVAQSAPLIRLVAASETGVTVNWFSTVGTAYRVQMKPALTADWADVPGEVMATGATASKTMSPTAGSQCFFRVIAVP